MTEIAFLVSLMTKYKLPQKAKEEIISRIGDVESQLVTKPNIPPASHPTPMGFTNYAPSVRGPKVEETPLITQPVSPQQPVNIDKKTGRPLVPTGNGTFGPKKF